MGRLTLKPNQGSLVSKCLLPTLPLGPTLRRAQKQFPTSHMLDFLAAIDKRSRPIAGIEQGQISTASYIVANLAMKTGRLLSYDSKALQIIGDEEASKLIRRPYRQPWQRPERV